MSAANRRNATETVRNFNAAFRPGTVVIFEGRKTKTSGPAALSMRDVPSVFLDDESEPIPLDRLQIPGFTWGPVKRTNERPS